MRRTGEREKEDNNQGGEVDLMEDVEWEKIWGRCNEGNNVIPPALEGLG